jgi:predicted Ser/Thr protein kinase
VQADRRAIETADSIRVAQVPRHPTHIGRFEVVNRLGRGGMGTLYLARDPLLDRQVAIKLLTHDDDDLRERFAREAQSAARLRHPHIVTVFDVGEHEGRPFIAMEYIQGRTIDVIVKERADLTLPEKLKLLEELCEGLGFAHQAGVVHRDIKPANLIVDAHGALKILDFGIARVDASPGITQIGMLIGTPSYMAPEQIQGHPADFRSDIFAVGAVSYELLSYRKAFPAGDDAGVFARLRSSPEPLEQMCDSLDPEIVRVVNRALDKDPSARYQDLREMGRDLRHVRLRLDRGAKGPETAESSPTPTPGGTRRTTARMDLERRRAAQIQSHLDTAQQAFEAGELDLAVFQCEEALLLDAEHAEVIALLERVRAGLDERQAQEWLRDAEVQVRLGAITAAHALVDRAAALVPSSERVALLRRAIEEAAREREAARQRARAIQQALDRAHGAFDNGRFEEAVAGAGEALALDPDLTEAARLRDRAQAAFDERQRAEHDRNAREAVREANRLFSAGSHQAALELLDGFAPPHDLVSETAGHLRNSLEAIHEARRQEAERRARQARVSAEIARARAEIEHGSFAAAFDRLRHLASKEGEGADIAAATVEVQQAIERDRAARVATAIGEHLERAERLLARDDYDGAMAEATAALALERGSEAARALHQRAQLAKTAAEDRERALAEQRRADADRRAAVWRRPPQPDVQAPPEATPPASASGRAGTASTVGPPAAQPSPVDQAAEVRPAAAAAAAAAATASQALAGSAPRRTRAVGTPWRLGGWIGAIGLAAVVLLAGASLLYLGMRTPEMEPALPPGEEKKTGDTAGDDIERRRQEAMAFMKAGDFAAAMKTASGQSPDATLPGTARQILDAVRERVEASRREAAPLAGSRPPPAFLQADARVRQFEDDVRAGRMEQAVQTGLDAAAQFLAFADARRTDEERRAAEVQRQLDEQARLAQLEEQRQLDIEQEAEARRQQAIRDKNAAADAQRQRELRISGEIALASTELGRGDAAAALARLRRLEDAEGSTPAIAGAIADAEQARQRADRVAAIRDHLSRARDLRDRNDFDGALAQIASALVLDAAFADTLALRDEIRSGRRGFEEKQAVTREQTAIVETVRTYVQGYNTLNPDLVGRAFPALGSGALGALRNSFRNTRAQTVRFEPAIVIDNPGATATASGTWEVQFESITGDKRKESWPIRLQLRKSGEAWQIVSRQDVGR